VSKEIKRGSLWVRPELRGRWEVITAGPKRVTLRSTLPTLRGGRNRSIPRELFDRFYSPADEIEGHRP
jgi:hypothetical protein